MSNDSKDGKHHEGDVAFIQSLAELLNASDLSELSVKREYGEHDRLTVSLSKQGKQITYAAPAPVAAPAVGIPAVAAADKTAEPALAPAAGTITVEVGPTAEELAAAEEAAEQERLEQEQQAAEEQGSADEQTSSDEQGSTDEQAASAEEQTETREAQGTANRSEERASSTSSSSSSSSQQEQSSSSNERSSSSSSNSSSSSSSSSSNSSSSNSSSSNSSSSSSSSSTSSSSSSSSSTKSEKKQESAPAPSAAKGSSILATARSGIGTPYVYGGTSPSGWDCSGFVQWVYAQHGISLPRGAAAQAAAGTVIPRSEARPGDLVYKPGHIGIYAGGNQFVDAGNSRVDTSERNIYSGSWTFIRIG